MRHWKCTRCREMVPESKLKQHVCSLTHALIPPSLSGNRLSSEVSGAISLAYLRGKQLKDEITREKKLHDKLKKQRPKKATE